jgi:hypothetical protein
MHCLLRPTAALRRLGVQWAFAAVLALALMPSLSRWMAPTGPSDWASICQAAPSGPTQQADQHGDACALCSLAHATPAIGGAAPATVAVLAYASPAPHADEPVRPGVPQARAPSARAPPAVG